MKISINKISSISVFVLVLAALTAPQQIMAQHFNHGGGGGGGFHSAPAPRPTINGGAQNMGNHNFRPAPAPARVNTPPVNNRPPANSNRPPNNNVRVNAPRGNFHENVNVYHGTRGGGGRAFAYHAHPYHPYSWGPRWHPLGFFLSSLAADAFYFSLANQGYYYDDGVYYEPYNGGYTAVAAPIGAVVSSLPDGYETVQVGDANYYYYGGTFYIDNGNGYQVVVAPIGAVVSQIPDGAVDQQINGQDYLVYNNTYFQPVSADGQDAYQVVQVN
jgi:Family of unknown function (DUF6515)